MTFSFLGRATLTFFLAFMPLNFGLNPFVFWFTLPETPPRSPAWLFSVKFESADVLSLQLEFSYVLLHSVSLVSVEFDSSVVFVEFEFSVVFVEFEFSVVFVEFNA